jgi:hypothetical protein
MKPETKKVLAAMVALTVVSSMFFVFGCNGTSLTFPLGAILILAGKELEELRRLKRQKEDKNNG